MTGAFSFQPSFVIPANAGISHALRYTSNMSQKLYYVYILTNPSGSVLYIGMTDDLRRRVYEHKLSMVEGFTKKYNCKKLVYYEEYIDVNQAIAREKQMKWWKREYKFNTVYQQNPSLKDLSERWA
jgi:putative endonuclease